jgi:hypothetical protein
MTAMSACMRALAPDGTRMVVPGRKSTAGAATGAARLRVSGTCAVLPGFVVAELRRGLLLHRRGDGIGVRCGVRRAALRQRAAGR